MPELRFPIRISARRFIQEGGKLVKDLKVYTKENSSDPKLLDQYNSNGLCKVIGQDCFGYHIDCLWVEVTALIES